MKTQKMRVLMIVEQCNPTWPSVPLVGYKFFQGINEIADVTLVTHERNRQGFEKITDHQNVTYIAESDLHSKYYKFVEQFAVKGRINWPLYHTLTYPVYADFNHRVYKQFSSQIRQGEYDIVHALTPMMPRYPFKAIKACQNTPFLLGPVNGGLPFPEGFKETAKKESANLNFLRAVGRSLIPGYVETYKKADRVLAGSAFTLNMLKQSFDIPDRKLELFYENGIAQEFLDSSQRRKYNDKVNLLFVGRLVPYKCADVVIDAISNLDQETLRKVHLTIVGDGSEKSLLEQQVEKLNLGALVHFAGWVNQQETLQYYNQSDIFCFPSIREFGGAVVLEAMACGLPCIVADNGGIAEYISEENGFKIELISKEYLTKQLTEKIKLLVNNEQLREKMSIKAVERAREFEWGRKAQKIVEIYEQLIAEKSGSPLQREQDKAIQVPASNRAA